MCKAVARRDAGVFYCPEGLEDFVAAVCGALNVSFSLAEQRGGVTPDARPSSLSVKQNETQSYCEIVIDSAGHDLAELLNEYANRYDSFSSQTYSVILNMAHASCPFAHKTLREHGYTFTGLSPLSSAGVRAIFCRSPSLPLAPENFALLPSFLAMSGKLR
jgi:hypothetical protein